MKDERHALKHLLSLHPSAFILHPLLSAVSPLRRMISKVISAEAYISFTSSHSLTVWMARMPVPRFAHSMPRLLKMFASQPPPDAIVSTFSPMRAPACLTSLTTRESSDTSIAEYSRDT